VPKWRYSGESVNATQVGFTILLRIELFREVPAEVSEDAESLR